MTRSEYAEAAPRPPDGEIDLREIVPGDGPVELDIGFGRGLSMLSRAQAAPESRIIGLEIKSKLAVTAARRCARLELHRVRIWAADVREVLARVRRVPSVDRAFIHFPDPWWKKRHQKRLVVVPETLDALAEILKPEGDLYIQTDVYDRAQRYVDDLRESGRFVLRGDGDFVDENPFGSISNRERRSALDGLPIFRIHAIRRDSV